MYVNSVNISGRITEIREFKTSTLVNLEISDEVSVKVIIPTEYLPEHVKLELKDPLFISGMLIQGKNGLGVQATQNVTNMRQGYGGTYEISKIFPETKK